MCTAEDYLNGVIMPGRRLRNCKLTRFTDGSVRDIHDELRGEVRFSILIFASADFGLKNGCSTKITDDICPKVIKQFPAGLVQPIILQPNTKPDFQWADLPSSIKQEAEMSLHNASADIYELWS